MRAAKYFSIADLTGASIEEIADVARFRQADDLCAVRDKKALFYCRRNEVRRLPSKVGL